MDPQITQIILAVITAVVSLVTARWAYKAVTFAKGAQEAAGLAQVTAAASVKASEANADAIKEVHKDVNGKMVKLLEVTAASSKAEGVLEQKERENH